jgi:hypothetical protein
MVNVLESGIEPHSPCFSLYSASVCIGCDEGTRTDNGMLASMQGKAGLYIGVDVERVSVTEVRLILCTGKQVQISV